MKENKQNTIAWIFLILAGLSEVAWAVGIKMTDGFTVLNWSIFTIGFMIVSFVLLARSLTRIPLGIAYAIFTGTGAAGAAVVGIVCLGESADWLKLVSLAVLIAGIIGLCCVGEPQEKREVKIIC